MNPKSFYGSNAKRVRILTDEGIVENKSTHQFTPIPACATTVSDVESDGEDSGDEIQQLRDRLVSNISEDARATGRGGVCSPDARNFSAIFFNLQFQCQIDRIFWN